MGVEKCTNNPLDVCVSPQKLPMPHVLIGDEAFALKTYLIRPFPRRIARYDLNRDIYNYRLEQDVLWRITSVYWLKSEGYTRGWETERLICLLKKKSV